MILITSPSLDTSKNISGVSAVTNFLIRNNNKYNYQHFELGKFDHEKRGICWLFRIVKAWTYWFFLILWKRNLFIHFNFALNKRSIIRDLPLILYAQLFKKKMVIHLHGGEYLENKDAPKWIKRFLKLSFSGKEAKIVLSPIEKELIIKKYGAKGVVVLPNSIEIDEAQQFNRNNNNIEKPIKLLFIGRIDKNKGIDYILQALSTLKSKNVPFKFIMAGKGPDRNFYVQKFSENIGSNFEYKGVVTGKEKSELFKYCNAFLLPSLYEGLPISLLECMSFGLVPIVTDVGSIKYVVTDQVNGFIVNKKSPSDIVNAIENLVSNLELLNKLGNNARQLIFTDFDPKVYIKKLNEIYDGE